MACRGLCDNYPIKRTVLTAYCRTCQKFCLKNDKNKCVCCNMKYRIKPRSQKKKKKVSKKEEEN